MVEIGVSEMFGYKIRNPIQSPMSFKGFLGRFNPHVLRVFFVGLIKNFVF